MKQRFFKLVDYFRNYTFSNDSLEDTPLQNKQSTHDHLIKLRTELQQSISNGKTLIDIYQQKMNQLSSENQIYLQEIEQLKQNLTDQKNQTNKLLQSSREIVEQLRKQLLEKDFENKSLNDKIQVLQADRDDELSFIKHQQKEEAFIIEKTINEEILKYENVIKKLQEELSQEKNFNTTLIEKLNQMEQQIETLSEDNIRLKQSEKGLRNLIEKQKSLTPRTPNDNSISLNPSLNEDNSPFAHELQAFDSTEQEFVPTSEDYILNQSYEQATPLKDILNCSDYNSNRYHRSKDFLRTKQKENIDENQMKITKTNSQKTNTLNNDNGKEALISKQSKQNCQSLVRDIQQFIVTDHQSKSIEKSTQANIQKGFDPYYAYFTLSAQCIKINSKHFQEIAQVDIVSRQWEYVISNRIPMNMWAQHLQMTMLTAAGVIY